VELIVQQAVEIVGFRLAVLFGDECLDLLEGDRLGVEFVDQRFEPSSVFGGFFFGFCQEVDDLVVNRLTVGYFDDVDGVGVLDRGKAYVDTDERGRTGVGGLYAAGRLASTLLGDPSY